MVNMVRVRKVGNVPEDREGRKREDKRRGGRRHVEQKKERRCNEREN